MEMESSRRSALDRSRDSGTKKPRLAEEAERDRGSSAGVIVDRTRPYAQARPAVGAGNPKFRTNDKEREERDEEVRGISSYQQQQELVVQYRTALAELTFNSKPIITNLSIIAGENHHTAKSIADTVCANVLEVPSEQKLPSLYLLDSIVKNIGRDYIKYFAARLPEVFCKAYKQVDPSIHHSLRHLFGTWKGVFPRACLQSIENELGFQPIINGSAGGTETRSDGQAQRAPHSIHVNPKYLEARQRLQQSTRGKGISSEDIDEDVDDAERSIRTPSAGSTRQWSEVSKKTPNVQLPPREQSSDFINDRKGYKDVRDPDFSSEQDMGSGKIVRRVKKLDELGRTIEPDEANKLYYEAGGENQSAIFRRNGFDANHAYDNYRGLGSAPSQVTSIHSNRRKTPTSKNWKTSEEEEFVWDDAGSRSVDYGGASNKKGGWSTEDPDKPTNLQSRMRMPSLETDQVDSRLDAFQPRQKVAGTEDRIHLSRDHEEEQHYSLLNSPDVESRVNKGGGGAWPLPLRDTPLPALGLDRMISSERYGVLSANDNSVTSRPGFQSSLSSSLGPSMAVSGSRSGSGGILGHQRQLLPLRSPSPSYPSAPSAPLQQHKRGIMDQDYLPVHSSQIGQTSSQLAGQFNRDRFAPVIHDSFPSLPENQGSKVVHTTSLNSQPALSPFPEMKQHLSSLQQSQSDTLMQAAILKNDLLPNKPGSGKPGSGFNILQPPLPSGPPPAQAVSSSSAPALTPPLPPLPPGPPPSTSLVGTTSETTSSAANIGLNNPLSSLLSSLVAKGIITSTSTPQLPTVNSSQMSKESSSQSSGTSTPPSFSEELPVCESEFDDLIGIQFKAEIVREFHPSVVHSLLDDLKHQCSACGLRFRHREQLRIHFDWHNSEKSSIDKMCRRWYSSIECWVSGDVEPPCGPVSVVSLEAGPSEEPFEPMVTADETQCICALCGEPFEDLYSIERDEWMYKGTVYLNVMDEKCVSGGMEMCFEEARRPIVHAKCISASAVDDDDAQYS